MKIQYQVFICHIYLKLLFIINVPYAIKSNISMFALVYCHLVDLMDFNSCFNILMLIESQTL